jgi:hypothetical protein
MEPMDYPVSLHKYVDKKVFFDEEPDASMIDNASRFRSVVFKLEEHQVLVLDQKQYDTFWKFVDNFFITQKRNELSKNCVIQRHLVCKANHAKRSTGASTSVANSKRKAKYKQGYCDSNFWLAHAPLTGLVYFYWKAPFSEHTHEMDDYDLNKPCGAIRAEVTKHVQMGYTGAAVVNALRKDDELKSLGILHLPSVYVRNLQCVRPVSRAAPGASAAEDMTLAVGYLQSEGYYCREIFYDNYKGFIFTSSRHLVSLRDNGHLVSCLSIEGSSSLFSNNA